MNRLATRFAGLAIANPIIIGSGPNTDTVEDILRAEDAGAGAAITKSIGLHPPTPCGPLDQRRYSWHKGRGMHLKSTYLKEVLSLDAGCALVGDTARRCVFPVIASAFYPALSNEEDVRKWAGLLRALADAGAAAVQLDFFYIDFRKLDDAQIEQVSSRVERLCQSIDVPVFPKLNASMDEDLVRALCRVPSAAGFVLIDSIRCEPYLDLARGGSPVHDGELHRAGRSLSVLAGEPLLPLTLSMLQRVARNTIQPLCAGGGLCKADDVLECLLLGASAVHITSYLMRAGLRRIETLKRGLLAYLDAQQVPALDALIGSALANSSGEGNRFVKETPTVSQRVRFVPNLCVDCGVCERLGACEAFVHKPYRFEAHCDGCSLCVPLCPTRALVLDPVPSVPVPGGGLNVRP